MKPNRKLQVFVSSTFTDLKEERQAAVEAILQAKHIPAGMELFSAGDQSQMHVIKNWIDESDVYMLILGGRYGSVEAKSGKSYTHLEYEYALMKGKVMFALVLTEDFLDSKIEKMKRDAIEEENPKKYRKFKKLVESKIVAYCDDLKDIKLGVIRSLGDFEKIGGLIGWIPGDQASDTTSALVEIARLSKENSELKSKLSDQMPAWQSSISFEDTFIAINQEISNTKLDADFAEALLRVASLFNRDYIALLDYFLAMAIKLRISKGYGYDTRDLNIRLLEHYDLVTENNFAAAFGDEVACYELTNAGKQFITRLEKYVESSNFVFSYARLKEVIDGYTQKHPEFLHDDITKMAFPNTDTDQDI